MRALSNGNVPSVSLADALYRHRLLIACFVLAGGALGLGVYAFSPRQYLAEATVALNARRAEILPTQAVVAPQMPDIPELRTELDAISSRSMTARVIERLGSIPEDALPKIGGAREFFKRLGRSLLPAARSHKAGDESADDSDNKYDIVGRVLSGLKVSNDGRSYTIHIEYTASTPQFAAEVAQAYADEYLSERSNLVAAVAKDASKWLGGNLAALRATVQTSETAVQQYRQKTGLLGEKGTPLLEQTIAEVNRELVAAEAARVAAQARLQTAVQLQQNRSGTHSFPQALNSPVIQDLVKQETETLQAIRQLQQAGAYESPRLPGLRARLTLIRQRIGDQAERVVGSMHAELEAAEGKETRLQSSLAEAESKLAVASAASVHLKQLESEAKANRSVYESFLNRYKQTIEQVNFQSPDARLLTAARVPGSPASPKLLTMLALGTIGGGTLGFGLALWRNRQDGCVHLVGELEELTQVPVLAAISDIRSVGFSSGTSRFVKPEAQRALGRLSATLQFYRPTSRSGVLAVTSSHTGEGKTSFSVALARHMVTLGRKVVVVDAKPATFSDRNWSDDGDSASLGERQIKAALETDTRSPAHFLHAGGLIAKQGFLRNDLLHQLIAGLREHYDLIIMDTPALSEGAEAVQLAAVSDAVLLLARLGKVERAEVLEALRQLTLCEIPVTGIIALSPDAQSRRFTDAGLQAPVVFQGPEIGPRPPAVSGALQPLGSSQGWHRQS